MSETNRDDISGFNRIAKQISEKVFNRQVGIFLIFLAISTLLWFVTSLNEEVQRQVTCRLRLTNVPDSVVLISDPPEEVTATVRGRGTHFFRHLFGSEQTIDIDFRSYVKGNRFVIGKNAFVNLVQQKLGDDRLLQEVYPDTIGLYFTTYPPVKLPVKVEINVSPSRNMHLMGAPKSQTDSVLVYGIEGALRRIKAIKTADKTFADVSSSRVIRVPLVSPVGCRVVPDSVDIKINIEPYVTEVRNIPVTAINVPEGMEMVFKPSKVKASYRIPKSQRSNLPEVKVIADYTSVADNPDASTIAINIDPWRSYVFIDDDSVNFYLRRQVSLRTRDSVPSAPRR